MDARDAFLERAKDGGIIPVMREVITDADTPVAAFTKIARPPFAFLLESLVGGERWARYTFMGTEPREAWRYRGTRVDRWTPATGWEQSGETDDPITHLADRMRPSPTAGALCPVARSPPCRASPAARSGISATTSFAASSGCPTRRPTRSAC